MVAALVGTRRETGLDLAVLSEIKERFVELFEKYRPDLEPNAQATDTDVGRYQIPAWMLARLKADLRAKGAEKLLPQVLDEIPRVRAEMGYPPLVTPASQVVGAQAVANVLSGERYADILPETRDYFLGLFGAPPAGVDKNVRRLAIKDAEPISVRPAELLDPLLERARKDLRKAGVKTESPEDLLSFILFPVAGLRFLRGEGAEKVEARRAKAAAETKPAAPVVTAAAGPGEYSVDVDGEVFAVRVTPTGASFAVTPAGGVSGTGAATGMSGGAALPAAPSASVDGALTAPMQGLLLKVAVSKGDAVKLGDVVAVLEAMKMQNDLTATRSGTVREIYVREGAVVTPGQVLMVIN
jgi:pyruvate carboxylase subunit B